MLHIHIDITNSRLALFAFGNTCKSSLENNIKQLPNCISFDNKNHFTNGSVV